MTKALFPLVLFFSGVVLAHAQQPSVPTEPPLKLCQEQLADVRSSITQIHMPNIVFQAETLVTLNRKLGEAQQQQARDAATISELRREVEVIKMPIPPGN